ncbi:fumarate reductase subunit FrdC [Photobacterium sp. GJ3]|uniref:fumarate reductase subunit FrdC n=1 Tax=Photobacterium sp. GJ3 TaxID=2829502 RepID=UPI001B8C95E9|nr:fumarate reductase subunit FrdC [Photobacterium sp. GJ3]QUJ67800.1 fumarate reductase subunit FrdC [Photobacterium sp. GJ3]
MSHRKPYVRPMKRDWWLHHPFYRFYMLREATVVPLVCFTVLLACGLGALVRGPAAWQGWLALMSHPVIIAINLVALAGSLLHAFTFFKMMPQVMPIRLGSKVLDKKWVIGAQWTAAAVISLVVLWLV